MYYEKLTLEQIEEFLKETDKMFPVAISEKTDIRKYARKLYEHATICAEIKDGRIVSAVFGYTNDTSSKLGYVSAVATLPEARRNHYASQLIEEFLEVSKAVGLEAVHLYAKKENVAAVMMYKKLGFCGLHLKDEQRPEDVHLIRYIY